MKLDRAARFQVTLFWIACVSFTACGGKTDDILEASGGRGQLMGPGRSLPMPTGGIGYVQPVTGGSFAGTSPTPAGGSFGGAAPASGGFATTTIGSAGPCAAMSPPSATGKLSITSGYVTVGALRGYGFTFSAASDATCVTPRCGDTGCLPPFSATALCAKGVVAGDPTYSSIAGIGFNLNQANSGLVMTVGAPVTVTVGMTYDLMSPDNGAIRIQLIDTSELAYCVEGGAWQSGVPIPISQFNTACWDDSGDQLSSGTPITRLEVLMPGDSIGNRYFGFCLTDVSFD